MSATMKSVFLLLMATGVILVMIKSIQRGVVNWRNGSPAATRDQNPVAFWAFISLFLLVAAAMVASALHH